MKTGIELITEERTEQIEKHKRSIQKDFILNSYKQLCWGAKSLLRESLMDRAIDRPISWDESIWRKMIKKSYKERLVIAGALLAAEVDRIQYKHES